jgi:hypothetical protein
MMYLALITPWKGFSFAGYLLWVILLANIGILPISHGFFIRLPIKTGFVKIDIHLQFLFFALTSGFHSMYMYMNI